MARADSPGDDVVMAGLAADDAAECDHAVIRLFARGRAVMRDHDGGRDLQRTGHRDHIEDDSGILQHAFRAAQQHVGDVVVEARLDDENARALDARLFWLCLAARSCH